MTTQTAEQIARERAEIEQADRGAPWEPALRGGDLVRVDFSPDSVERLRVAQRAAGDRFRPSADEERRAREAEDPALLREIRRRARLVEAGVERPEAKPQREAWERVARAADAHGAAMPGHGGSLLAMRTIDRWATPAGHAVATLVMVGPPGVGKTVAGWYALAMFGGLYVGADEIAPCARWDEVRARSRTARLVVVNDVTTERLSEAKWGLLAGLVDDRHDRGQRTLLTTNLARAELLPRLGRRTADRIGSAGGGQGVVLEIAGESLRGRQA